MIIIYTGNGKGKTSACVGQAMRAHGRGLTVAFGQFMKRPDQAGEQRVCTALFGSRFKAVGPGFLRTEAERPQHREAAGEMLAWAEGLLGEVDMLILDEALYALGADLISRGELEQLLNKAEAENTHVVLSGRGAPEWLCERAHLVSELVEIKHPFASGHKATPGIEY